MIEPENGGLSINEEKAEMLLRAREAKAKSLENSKPPEGIKTRADLKSAMPDTNPGGLGKASIFHKKQAALERTEKLGNEIGNKIINLEDLPSAGMFYEPGTEISIRACRVEEIRHFSTIDETDIIDVDDKLNYIIERCCRIRVPGNRVQSYKDILEIDRFYLVFAIRELTFSEGENQIQVNLPCDECNNIDTVNIERHHLNNINLDERLQKYFNPEERCFTFETKTGEVFNLYFATLGVTEFMKKFIKNRASKGQKLDQSYLTIAPFLFPDWRTLTDKTFSEANYETLRWGIEKLSIMTGMVDVIRQSGNNDIVQFCSSCGAEVRQPITFQGGYKSLFIITDIFERLV